MQILTRYGFQEKNKNTKCIHIIQMSEYLTYSTPYLAAMLLNIRLTIEIACIKS